jgi:hypothetical protein
MGAQEQGSGSPPHRHLLGTRPATHAEGRLHAASR